MDVDSPSATVSALPPTEHHVPYGGSPDVPSDDTIMISPPKPDFQATRTSVPPSELEVASQHSSSQVSASRVTAATAPSPETNTEAPASATQTSEQVVSAAASTSVSASASVSAADDGEHNDSTSTSSGASVGPASQISNGAPADVHVAGADESPDGLDRFLRRMEMEKRIAQLQQRLELASIKANHGWSDMTINEIEGRLPKQPLSRRPPIVIPNGNGPTYEPPSPSRPWQLADVLWQPLPRPGAPTAYAPRPAPHISSHVPSHSLPGGLPSIASLGAPGPGPPASPSRRMGMDDYLARPTLSPLRGHHSHGGLNGHAHSHRSPGVQSGHRRAASSISGLPFLSKDPYPPPGPTVARPKKNPKKRSQSQSNLRERPTTQDVDAARALTSMLGSGRSPMAPEHDRRRDTMPSSAIAPGSGWPGMPPPRQDFPVFPPPPHPSTSLPSPFGDMPPPRPRAQSFMDAERLHPPMGRPHLPPPPLMPAPGGFATPKSHMGHSRGVSMDSSTFDRSFWRRSPDKDREREREYERERERDREMRQHHDRQHWQPPHPQHDRVRDEGLMTRPEDDQAAAELMMFLAHSPSPIRPSRNSATRSSGDGPTFTGPARVLFNDMPPRGADRSAGSMPPPLNVRR